MKYLTLFIQKSELLGLAIQELLSLLTLENIPTKDVFGQQHDIPLEKSHFLSPEDFANFPYIYTEIPENKKPSLVKILARAVSISNFAEVLAEGKSEDEFKANLDKNSAALLAEVEDLRTYSIDIKSHLKRPSPEEKLQKILGLGLPQFKAKCELSAPERVFYIIEDFDKNGKLKRKYFAKDLFAVRKHKSFVKEFSLSDRIFLGPTSTDAELSFLMANQALAAPGKIVYDPFIGTGSILVAASALGAFCFGCDIDIRVLMGYGIGRLNKNSSFFPKMNPSDRVDVFLNFKQYRLALPELLRTDSTSLTFGCEGLFDAIVCDPPYGIRAGARQAGQKHGLGNEALINAEGYCIPTKKSTCFEITDRLFELGRRALKSGGRLVFLFSVELEADPLEHFQQFTGFVLVAVSKNRLNNSSFARFLFTFEKL